MQIAVDVGNTRIQFGIRADTHSLRIFSDWKRLITRISNDEFAQKNKVRWDISSVNPRKTETLLQKIRNERPGDSVRILHCNDIPISVNVEFPEKVGMDRILAAFAVKKWRDRLKKRLEKENKPNIAQRIARRSFLICDFGTATTFDLLSPDGVFEGGAILPGLELSAKSLNLGTAQLPDISHSQSPIEIPAYPGKRTEKAIASGIFWGTIGSIRQFVDLVKKATSLSPVLVIAGGNAKIIREALNYPARYFPNLVIRGIFELKEEVYHEA